MPNGVHRDRNDLLAANTAGAVPQKFKGNYGQYIWTGTRRIKIQSADGSLTIAGDFYYDTILGIARPTLYTYDQELERDRWVRAYDGSRVKVRQ